MATEKITADDPRITGFLTAWHQAQRADFERNYDRLVYDDYAMKTAHERRRFIACDRGNEHTRSGVYLVDRATGEGPRRHPRGQGGDGMTRVDQLRGQLRKIDERIGFLMGKRAELEERLGAALDRQGATENQLIYETALLRAKGAASARAKDTA